MSPKLQSWFSDYKAFHQTRGNEACHFVAVPTIVFSVLAMAGKVPIDASHGLYLAELVIAASFVFYLFLDVRLAILMLVLSVGLDALGRFTPLGVAFGLFVGAWILQFVGHYVFEARSPAFFRNLTHLLVGPLWVLARATGQV